MSRDILKAGYNISFTGSITFKNNKKAPPIIAAMPSDRYMIETDAPYMTPVPHRGKRNDSSYLKYIAEFIADIRGITPEQVAAETMENGKKFFGIE